VVEEEEEEEEKEVEQAGIEGRKTADAAAAPDEVTNAAAIGFDKFQERIHLIVKSGLI
jgi:hypothetical protein